MALFHVQDDDRPMYVIAEDFPEAIKRWQRFIRTENNTEQHEQDPQPSGVTKIADSDEVILR